MKMPFLAPMVSVCVLLCSAGACGAETETRGNVDRLWPSGNPGGWERKEPEVSEVRDGIERISQVSEPTLTYSAPTLVDGKLKDVAVIICPGGAYRKLAIDHEGRDIAAFLNGQGAHAFILKYRLPREGDVRYEAALQDAQRAIRLVRASAAERGIDPGKVGIMGFSAGGHLTATASNQFDAPSYEAVDAADGLSCRPDFAALIYPAYLVKGKESGELADEVRVSAKTPPTFLMQTSDDGVMVENAVFYYLALKEAKVTAELHVFDKGPHGYGLGKAGTPVGTWSVRLAEWLRGIVELPK
jgi:acetyl esterase/lipase